MLKILEQWIFPHCCGICEQYTATDQDLCNKCKAALPWVDDRCYQCGSPLDMSIDSLRCQPCYETPPNFDRLCALFNYEQPVIQLVKNLKFGQKLAYGKILGQLLAEKIPVWYKDHRLPQAILPIPLHNSRLRQRGFNQALELLWPQAHALNIPIVLNLCKRIYHTPPQASLDKRRRKRNMKGIFQITTSVVYEHIAIIDDVVTTSSTVNAVSATLKEAGVERVDVWTICRA